MMVAKQSFQHFYLFDSQFWMALDGLKMYIFIKAVSDIVIDMKNAAY